MLRDKMFKKNIEVTMRCSFYFGAVNEQKRKKKLLREKKITKLLFWYLGIFIVIDALIFLCLSVGSCRCARIPFARIDFHSLWPDDINTSDRNEKGHNCDNSPNSMGRKSWEFLIYIRLWVSLYDNSFSFG